MRVKSKGDHLSVMRIDPFGTFPLFIRNLSVIETEESISFTTLNRK